MPEISVLLELFLSFARIGFTSFGGLSMIPQINSEMLSHGWMTAEEVMDIVAIAEMTPGPLALNAATFAGIRTAGVLGAVFTCLGVLTPTFTVAAAASFFFEKFKSSRLLQNALFGIRPAAVGMIAGVVWNLAVENYWVGGGPALIPILIGALSCWLLFKAKLSIPKTIGVAAALGVTLLTIFP